MAQGTSLPWPRGRTSVMTVHLSICIFVDSCSRAEGALKRGGFSRMAWAREPLVAKNKNRPIYDVSTIVRFLRNGPPTSLS